MSKYRILRHATTADCYLDKEEYESVDDAVVEAISYGSDDFLIITVVPWKAVANEEAS